MNHDGEKYDAVFKPKAWAALYLNHALEKFNCDKLEFLWLFSSVATYGNPGQSPYSVPPIVCWIRCRATATPRACPARRCSGPVRFLRPIPFSFRDDGVAASPRSARARPRRRDGASRRRERDPPKRHRRDTSYNTGWGEVGMAAGFEGFARKRMEESPMPFFTNAQGLAGMDVGCRRACRPFCVMRYNASAFFDQSNAEAKNASAHYMRKFWGQSIPPKELTELDVYDAVKSNFYEPHELTFAHFISGSELDEP